MYSIDEPARPTAWLTPALLALSIGLNALFMIHSLAPASSKPVEAGIELAVESCGCENEAARERPGVPL